MELYLSRKIIASLDSPNNTIIACYWK